MFEIGPKLNVSPARLDMFFNKKKTKKEMMIPDWMEWTGSCSLIIDRLLREKKSPLDKWVAQSCFSFWHKKQIIEKKSTEAAIQDLGGRFFSLYFIRLHACIEKGKGKGRESTEIETND